MEVWAGTRRPLSQSKPLWRWSKVLWRVSEVFVGINISACGGLSGPWRMSVVDLMEAYAEALAASAKPEESAVWFQQAHAVMHTLQGPSHEKTALLRQKTEGMQAQAQKARVEREAAEKKAAEERLKQEALERAKKASEGASASATAAKGKTPEL